MSRSLITSRLLFLFALLTAAGCCLTFTTAAFAQSEADQKQTAQTYTVSIHNFVYKPAKLTVHAGDTIEWKNTDTVPHTVTDQHGSFDSKEILPNASWTYVATQPGTYHYTCTPHPTMQGTFTVH